MDDVKRSFRVDDSGRQLIRQGGEWGREGEHTDSIDILRVPLFDGPPPGKWLL